MVGLVEQREVLLGQVGDGHVETAVRLGGIDEPLRDGQADPAGAGARDDYQQIQVTHG